ncbi:MAG: helix-turn-helix domain-containing protein [Solirubrobacteraceae bacterium]|nr:helix-turn-helix domain-containing protein [Solirubrobacteraceae bacterium]
MALLFDTATVAPDERPERWGEACDRIFFPMRATGGALASSRIERHHVGPIELFRLVSDHGVGLRTGVDVRAYDPEVLLIALAVRGRSHIEQDGRRAGFSVGDLSSWQSSRPFRAMHFEPFELMLLSMPRTLLGARADAICRQTARRLPGDSPLGKMTTEMLRQTWRTLDADEGTVNRGDLADALIALVRAVHSQDAAAPQATRAASGAALLTQVKAHVEANLGDPDLGLQTLARRHHVSPRYLQKLFAEEGLTVTEYVRARRLEACRRDLCDPALAHETISEVARRWGLPNPAHFSRVFREAFGCTPSDLRADALGAGR